jgi:hypothetical protein
MSPVTLLDLGEATFAAKGLMRFFMERIPDEASFLLASSYGWLSLEQSGSMMELLLWTMD